MDLKRYQRRVADEVELFLRALADEQAKGNRHASLDAWRARGLGRYEERENGLDKDLSTFCIKVPTGGGKTLLATQALGSIYRTILRHRNGAGLAVWVVPSSQIYADTLRRLRDRTDIYRIMLEHAVGRRIELWEKHELNRLSPARLRDCLNILIVQLASTNRETKEQLKFFRDSGGSIVDHFPPENDLAAHRTLREQFPNLEVIEGTDLIKTSVGNLVRLCEPPVILDEGHKATSAQARETIEGFNASVVVELSATPAPWKDRRGGVHPPNILTSISGEALLEEEMIKLPINIATSGQKNWKDVLTQARDKRSELAKKAAEWAKTAAAGNGGDIAACLIRPIVLVQVERTGKDQREAGLIHAKDVEEYLLQRLSVPAAAIAIKTAEDGGLENVDLMDPGCPVEWIITKSALQEGWDCPFAYILVSLNNTGSGTAMTQLVGRILRQPNQKRTGTGSLDECYVYCLHERPAELSRHIKKALEKEGYEGDLEGVVVDASGKQVRKTRNVISMRREFAGFYREFEGKVYLPKFCVKHDGGYRPLDYFSHLISRVDPAGFDYKGIDWPLAEKLREAKDRFFKVNLGKAPEEYKETEAGFVETDEQALAWMVATIRFDFLSHKQLKLIVRRVYERLCAAELQLENRLSLVKFPVREHTERFIQEQVDRQTEAAFRSLFKASKIVFYLDCRECRFEIPPEIKIESKGALTPLTHPDDGKPVAKSLFDFVEREGKNDWERSIALCLDRDEKVLWWYRNCVGKDNFSIQGYRKSRIFPDFVVQGAESGEPVHRVLVLESKGSHLEGNPDTKYKRAIAGFFEDTGKKVSWQKLGEEFKDHVFRFQVLDEAQPHGRDWKDELKDILAM